MLKMEDLLENKHDITLCQSNRTEVLLDRLEELLRVPLSNPLAPETIVVQSKGMERWISLSLAERLGCCANMEFPFPNKFIQSLFAHLMPELKQPFDTEMPQQFDRDVITWQLMQHIPEFLSQEPFQPLANYLTTDSISDLKRIQLCERIANTFDQYIIFRPEMIASWEKGAESHWQAILWRFLTNQSTDNHDARLGDMAIQRMFNAQNTIQPFAERIFVFGISALTGFHTRLLIALSQLCDVHFFLLNPSQEYWGDIRSKREISKIQLKEKQSENAELYFEEGHPLLASMGKMGRDFLNLLFDFMDNQQVQMHFDDRFVQVTPINLLTHIQSQLFELNTDHALPTPIDPNDCSIRLHACHSKMREVEILYDQLLHLFETNSDLEPQDVLVMTPDIEAYAPIIQAVFDHPVSKNRIPYTISDRSQRKQSQIIDAFFMILDLPGSRLEAVSMLPILECQAVARRFNIAQDDLPMISHWLEKTRLRWGQSAEFRTQFGMGAYPENTWEHSLDRLLLGYAMPGEDDHPFCNILPFDAIEGQSASLVGHLAQWAETLFKIVKMMDTERSLMDWIQVFDQLLNACFLTAEDEDIQLITIRKALHRLEKISVYLNKNDTDPIKIHYSAIKWYLRHILEKPRSHLGFLSGYVTCCAMLPMRAIPFKVICMIGLNDIDYPRRDHSPNFDFIARNPKPGDRSLRNDDRYIFLEAILSARNYLYMSYIGHDISDNSPRPPSVLISELLDYIDDHFTFQEGNARDNLVISHRLQAFHPAYFLKDSSLLSYSRDNCAAARLLIHPPTDTTQPFLSKAMPHEMEYKVHISQLISFFRHPIRYFFNNQLGIFLYEDIQTFDRHEPFKVNGLDKYWLQMDILDQMISGNNPYAYLDQARAKGILPLGQIGRMDYYDIIDSMIQMYKNVSSLIKSPLPELSVDLKIDRFHIYGTIQNRFEKGFVMYRPAKVKPEDYISCWIYHLIQSAHQGTNQKSHIVGIDRAYEMMPTINSQVLLKELLELFHHGMSKPLHFFPKSSYAFIEEYVKLKDTSAAIKNAQKIWYTNPNKQGAESDNLYYARFLKNDDPFDDDFIAHTKRFYLPLHQHLRKKGLRP